MEGKSLPIKKYYTPPKEELRNEIMLKMKELDLWREDLANEIPTYWDNFQNFVIFNSKFFVDECWKQAGSQLWECVSKLFSGKSIALQGKIQNDHFRSPNAILIYGKSPWVEFLDNGIIYTWNVEFTMFCTGNISERHRIAGLNCTDLVIVDMFAGIGYFTLPYLVHAGAKQVIACDWNPISVQALRINIAKNKVADKCVVIEGDVRLTCPRNVADQINLGLIPFCEEYWPIAAEIIKSSGGTMRVHGNVSSFSPKSSKYISIDCQKCISLVNKLSIDLSQSSKTEFLKDYELKILADKVIDVKLVESGLIRWKKLHWFIWGVHVSHCFGELLYKRTETIWKIAPLFVHRVKGYAPHIDHLVIDIFCKNELDLPVV